jgi:predicted anti-sigma-YlaC factor YlaD
MQVTRDVILDLLPLYLAGEASAQTEALVQEHLANDPDLARLAQQWQERLPGPPPAPVHADAQALAFQEAKRRIAVVIGVVASVIAAGVVALAALVFFMFFHSPG